MNVSGWFSVWFTAACLSLATVNASATATGPQRLEVPAVEQQVGDDAPASASANVVTRHSLAAHLGMTADEAVFSNPRNFRTESLNADHMDIEPLFSADAD